jgi:hypothetical protein
MEHYLGEHQTRVKAGHQAGIFHVAFTSTEPVKSFGAAPTSPDTAWQIQKSYLPTNIPPIPVGRYKKVICQQIT